MKPWTTKPMPPFNRHLGFEIAEWRQDHIVIMADVKPEHCNHSGIPHGGFIATLLDAATALPGVFCNDPDRVRKALTLSLNINFLGQARGERLKAMGRVTASGRRIFYSAAEVYDMDDTLIASAQGVFRYRTGSELNEYRDNNKRS
jgi:uncharacterized protein (TIGR00369 family)